MNLLFIFTWVVSVLSICGAYLNAKGKWQGFVIWIFTNISWITINIYYGVYAQAFLFVIYTGVSTYGLITWLKKLKEKK